MLIFITYFLFHSTFYCNCSRKNKSRQSFKIWSHQDPEDNLDGNGLWSRQCSVGRGYRLPSSFVLGQLKCRSGTPDPGVVFLPSDAIGLILERAPQSHWRLIKSFSCAGLPGMEFLTWGSCIDILNMTQVILLIQVSHEPHLGK